MHNTLFRRIGKLAAIAAAAGSFLVAQPAAAQGDLLVAPTRVILDGRRGTQIILSNIGTEAATYRISLVLRRMTPNGALADVANSEANAAEAAALDMIRYAPRRITLPPGQPQSVRLSARPGPELPDGEYRAHMEFKALPKPKPVTEEKTVSQGVAIQLIPIYAITIPIIIRHGQIEAQVAILPPQIVQTGDGARLNIDLARSGKASTYGDLSVFAQGSDEPILRLGGVAIYAEVATRHLSAPLTPVQLAALHGPIRIEYRETQQAGADLIASAKAALP